MNPGIGELVGELERLPSSPVVAAKIGGLVLLLSAWLVAAAAAGPVATARPVLEAPSRPPEILVSRQLLASQHLAVGDELLLSGDPAGAQPQPFRIAGVFEPLPDPARLGAAALEVRLHLPDLVALAPDPGDPLPGESVQAINVKLADPRDATAFTRDLAARVPWLVVRETARPDDADVTFVVLERFHLAIAVVTVLASSIFLLALMVMLVDERRQTVAILRLMGVRRRRVFIQVLAEGIAIALAGALFGVALAVVLEGAFNRFFQFRYDTALVFVRVTPAIAARSVSVAVPLGILASLTASWGLIRQGALSVARR
jgi:putative ABC transport system permease protein